MNDPFWQLVFKRTKKLKANKHIINLGKENNERKII